ncbi:RecF/RecN/SMC N terminal domain-containing protein [Tirmania nivea]|nr:RecF/RecN/SMC N terminal domain-containing protein [Tirmania nivea]
MRAATEDSIPTSENKRSLEAAFPEGTGNTPDRRRPASMAFPDGDGYTPNNRRPSQAAGPQLASFALGSPPRTMAIGSPSRMRRSATPQVLQSVAEPQSPSLSQHVLLSAQVPAKMPQLPLSSQHVPYTQVVPPVTHLQLPASQSSQPESEVPRQRTVITHLVMTNFKSYAGRQEVGPFHPSFSSVVGPNGSGKSNVIDSLLFVFGFRASKMRQGKISALIHNSANHMDLQFCEVEVHFQEVIDLPGGAHEVVPDSTLIIARRAFKNNSSKYTINGRESNFTQVTTLLRDRGVDLDHKRFLILQGEVESIAQMKPKGKDENDDGLLEYLEDIIGTSKYKQPIEDSAAQVETLNEVCLEKSTRVQHVEKEKNSLEDQKNLALDFIRDENELACKLATLYQVHILECADHINVTSELVTQVQAGLDEELEKHKGNEEGIKKLERKYKDMTKEIERGTPLLL